VDFVQRGECARGCPAASSLRLRDQLQRVIEDRQRGQAEKSISAGPSFEGDHVKGSNDFVVFGLVPRTSQSTAAAKSRSRGVHPRIANQPFHFSGGIEQLAYLGVFCVSLLHLR